MKKRILAVLIICLMALSAVGISVFAADHSKATLKVDKSSYSQGETVPVKLIISDTGFSDVGVMLKYNTEKLAPAGAGLKDNISTSYYSSADKTGIFDDDEDYMYRQNDTNGTLGYSFSIADKSTNSLVLTTTNETPNYRYIDASSEGGYLVATFNLKAKADITLGDGDLGFQKDPTTSNRDILVTLGTAKLDTAASVSIPEAPKPAGTVHVTVENQKATAAEGAAFTGVLVDKDVEITSTSTVLSAVQTALGDYTLEEKGGYISKINGLGAGVGADYAGWMATIEDWFTNNPLNQYTPADGTLKDGQQIKVVYSKTGGTDVGGDWSNNTKTLSALTTDAGTLSPAFDAGTKNYTLNIPASVSSVKITPTAANKNFQVHTYLGTQTEGKEYLRSQAIPVEDGSIITIVDGDPSWPSMNNGKNGGGESVAAETYTVTVSQKAIHRLTMTTTPGDAVVKVYDAQGAELKASSDGSYEGAFDSQTYTYTVTKTGYVAKTGNVPAEGGNLTVSLENAAANPESVSADWKNFRGNDQNNGITTAKTPKSADGAALLWSQKLGTGWSASPTPQIIVDNTLITGVNKNIYKLDLQTGAVLAKGDMVQSPSFAYSAPVYADGMIFIQLGGGTVQAFNATTLESLWVYTDPLKGQALSPITYADGYLYTGFWNSEAKDANYVCLSASDEDASKTDEAKTATWRHTQAGGFYWAGSVVVGDALIIGTDDGANGYNGDSHLLALNRINGNLISDTVLTGRGDQRSTITYDAGKIYFTTKNGYLCRADVDAQGNITNLTSKNYPEIGGQSTSTPVVYKGRVYFGMGGGVGSAGKFVACDAGTLDSIYTVDLVGYPQCSMLLSTAYEESNGNLYFYSTYNMNPGGIAMIEAKADGSSAKKVDLFDAKGFAQYCICSIIAGTDGTLYYKNDSGNILAVGFSAVGKLEAEIDALGTITLDSKAAIENAEASYKALSAEEQAQVTNYQTLLDARSAYDALVALQQAKETAGTTLENYKSADLYRDAEKAILANAITDGKAAINQATDLEGINTALAAAKTTIDAIKTDAQYDIEEAADLKTAQDAAIEELGNYKNKADYREAEQAQLDQSIQSYSEQIRAITIENNDLSGAKERVKTTLASGKTALDGIKTDAQYKVEEDQAAAAKIDAQIAALPAADQLTLENETAVTEARTAYEALTADQKVYVKNLETLKAAEAKISDLQAEAEAKPVIDKMSQSIGAINEKSETALDAYNEAITAYNALSPAAKGKADATKSAMDTALNTMSAKQHTKTADVTTEDGKKLAAAISDKDGKMLPLNIALEEIKTVTTENIEKAKAKLTGKDLVLGIGISINEDQMTDDQKAELAKNGYQVTISCDLTGYKTESIKVAHVLKDGKVEILDAQYDANAKTVTFITKSFSDFMVMAEKLPIENTAGAGNIAADGTNSTKNTATGITEGNLNTAFAGILIFAAVCGMAILVRKQKQD